MSDLPVEYETGSYYKPDDEVVSEVSFGEEEKEDEVGSRDLRYLREEVESLQRFVVSRLVNDHIKGSAERSRVVPVDKSTPEKIFRVSGLMEWNEGNPDAIVDRLRQGRVRTRVDAAMGVGKSTRLGPYIAAALNVRVLIVGLNSTCLQQMSNYIRKCGIGKIKKMWPTRKEAWVNVMTYADFNSHVAAATRLKLFTSFDVIIFDEAFVGSADVFCAKRCFSAYATADVSLLLCSATMRDDRGSDTAESGSMGTFTQRNDISVVDAIRSKKLVGDYLVDRMMVIVSSDSEISLLYDHYRDNGVDVKVLDTASTYRNLEEVNEWLTGESMTPRALIADEQFAIGFNFRVSYMIIWPKRRVLKAKEDGWEYGSEPMTNEMVSQAMARTGRGMVAGSGGIILGEHRSETTELYQSDRVTAFVKLCAAAIVPLKSGVWEDCYSIFPEGLQPEVACNLLKVALPPEIAARYLGSDGRFAKKFMTGLNLFTQPDHFLSPSDDLTPVSYGDWKLVDCPLPEVHVERPLSVPVVAKGEVGLLVYAITAVADNLFSLERWRPSRTFAMDMVDSDTEVTVEIRPSRRIRRVSSASPTKLVPRVSEASWSYSAVTSAGLPRAPRDGMFLTPRLKEALDTMAASVGEYSIPSLTEGIIRTDMSEGVGIVEIGMGQVESPGGTVVCELPVTICEKLNLGQILNADEFLELTYVVKPIVKKFVQSRVFDSFAGTWTSILYSLLDAGVLERVVQKGQSSSTFKMIDYMRTRYNHELYFALSKTNVYKRTFLKLFRLKPTVDQMVKAIREGKFDRIAQTNKFIDRVKHIKNLIDAVLVNAQRMNVYLPTYISEAQRNLPILPNNAFMDHLGGRSITSLSGGLANYFQNEGGTVRLAEIPTANLDPFNALHLKEHKRRQSSGSNY